MDIGGSFICILVCPCVIIDFILMNLNLVTFDVFNAVYWEKRKEKKSSEIDLKFTLNYDVSVIEEN